MLEILTTAQMYEADRLAVEGGVDSYELMENAGQAVFEGVGRLWPRAHSVLVVCGPGNNGGDGYVAARLLAGAGYLVSVVGLVPTDKLKGDARRAADRYNGVVAASCSDNPAKFDLVIDAMFGAGLDREVSGPAREMIEQINDADTAVLSVDVPSGLNADTGFFAGSCVRADATITFFRKKPGHLLLPGRLQCGDVKVADIGIPAQVLNTIDPQILQNGPQLWRDGLPPERIEQHKYSRGHTLAVAGGPGKGGAARLAARAALRAGAGLATLGVSDEARIENAARLDVVMIRACNGASDLTNLLSDKRFTSVVIGPGLGTGTAAAEQVLAALDGAAPVIIDADALTVFAGRRNDLFAAIRARPEREVILTPHAGEFARLFLRAGKAPSKLAATRAAAAESGAVVVYKGPDTIIAGPSASDLTAINCTGTPWLATAGSGDVLAGLIAGLAAKGTSAFYAACAGVWTHGRAAELFGPGLVSDDLSEMMPRVWQEVVKLTGIH